MVALPLNATHRLPAGALNLAHTAGEGAVNLHDAVGSSFYHKTLVPLLIVTTVLAWKARPCSTEERPSGFRRFQVAYLLVWALCSAADWLQGPYVYALYAAYDYSRHQIAQLFVAGFVSALVFSCGVGAVCDHLGRKKCALLYCLLYILSCLTKHVKSYEVLMLGRVAGGVATSLLFSCFECWMVSEHTGRHGFSNGLLGYMFGLMYTVNYLVAIVSGIIGEFVHSRYYFRPVAAGSLFYCGGPLVPFDLAIVCLLVGFGLILALWDENYGHEFHGGKEERSKGVLASLKDSLHLLQSSRAMLLVGLGVAAFEGTMYAFIFNWTPALESRLSLEPPPYGLIFALFMMSCMSGASVSILVDVGPAARLAAVFALGTAALAVAAAVCDTGMLRLCFVAFCLFEFCIGSYFPSMGVLKSEVVPERVRGTVYNLFRAPVNAIVILALLTNMSLSQVYVFCACLLAAGTACMLALLGEARGEEREGKIV